MKKITIITSIVAALVVLIALVPAAAAQSTNATICMEFEKTIVNPAGVWEGSVSGGVNGNLTTQLQSLEVTGNIWHVVFLWIVDAGDQSFTATMDGILNTGTGGVVMNGTVTEGWLLGATVHEAGQAQDAAGANFVGQICVMPATAG